MKNWIRGGAQPPQGAETPDDGSGPTSAVPAAGTTTQIAFPVPIAHLVGVSGPPELLGARFALGVGDTTIGRQADCDITVGEQRVSRVHATVRFDGSCWRVVHRSRTNATFVNGEPIGEPARVYDGDEIMLAGAVGFRLDAPDAKRSSTARSESLRTAMLSRVELEERIEREFVRDGTFLDVDVVDSYGLKTSETRPENIVVSFERFRELVDRCVVASHGQVLNSNGDEVMAFFDSADHALDAADHLLVGLAEFNRGENRLSRPFQIRMGAHTGRSAVDLNSGVAYSPVLDLAGHLQKAAPIDALLLSDATRAALSREHPMQSFAASDKVSVLAFLVHFGR